MNTAKTLVCFGDSITEGVIGASYVEIVRGALPGVRVINAGINGDTVIHLLRRVERDVSAHQPDLVTIMVGLNDLTTVYGLRSSKAYYHALKNLHTQVAPRRFIHAYRQLIGQLRARTHAQIALCTLTTVGEDPADPVQSLVDAYSLMVRGIAEQEGLPLIDVRAAFARAIEAEPRLGPEYRIWIPVQDALAIQWRGASYAGLAEQRGYRLLCDGAHLAPAGAALVAETVLPTIRAMLSETGEKGFRSQDSGVRLQQT